MLADAVGRQAVHGLELDVQLLGQRLQHHQRVIQEGAQVAHRPQLHGKTKPVVLTALLRDQRLVRIVEVEVADQIRG